MRERRKALSLRTGVVTVEDGAGREQNCEQGNGQEVNRELVFLPNEDLYKGSLPPLPTPEVAGDKSPAKIGVQETASPLAGHNSSGKRMTFKEDKYYVCFSFKKKSQIIFMPQY